MNDVFLKQSEGFEKNPLKISKNILGPLSQLKESITDEDVEKIKISNIFSPNFSKTLTVMIKVTLIQYIWQSAMILETIVVPINTIIFKTLADAALTTTITTAIGTLFGAGGSATGLATGIITSFLKNLPKILVKEIPMLINNIFKALKTIFTDNKLKGTPLIFPAMGVFIPLFSGPTATIFLSAFLIPFFLTQFKKTLEIKSKEKEEGVENNNNTSVISEKLEATNFLLV